MNINSQTRLIDITLDSEENGYVWERKCIIGWVVGWWDCPEVTPETATVAHLEVYTWCDFEGRVNGFCRSDFFTKDWFCLAQCGYVKLSRMAEARDLRMSFIHFGGEHRAVQEMADTAEKLHKELVSRREVREFIVEERPGYLKHADLFDGGTGTISYNALVQAVAGLWSAAAREAGSVTIDQEDRLRRLQTATLELIEKANN